MSKSIDERLNKLLALGCRIEGEAKRKQHEADVTKSKKAERRQWVETSWINTFRPKIESAIETLNQKLQMADMPKMRLTEPAPGTSARVEMELASEVSGRSIRSAVSLTDDHIQFQHYRLSSAQSVSVGHNVIGLNDFTLEKVNEVLIDVLDAFTRDFPK
ncbi:MULTISPECIES: hypothetical protein [unclassified Rhizobium]|uniref:hypothetical protein n=1 Tax=unclassified Rhizobium TaxID=2613769 RepID=UPI000713E669|nr:MULTISPECIES: hypothetical protein [unclassified Rhizobium]KQS95429.1 hypothetical protein ASG42_29840 [Rhizobium sp. Leaf391]KQT04686.1 hypothetical protein ASG50_15560 [Rhizobium sp. Leaf386]KQU00962.1 hypothetical protein ASG68_29190 [Rhizobium sp. Leaf453]